MIDSVIARTPVLVFGLSIIMFTLSIFYAFAPNTSVAIPPISVSIVSPVKVQSALMARDFENFRYQVANKSTAINLVYAQE